MRILPPLSQLTAQIEERRRAAGISDEMVISARNSGANRTAEKRELLRRMAERSRKAGKEPFAATF